jgi:hypothetical protein
MADRQFIACAFRKGDTRTYTYHNDGEPVAVGNLVVVNSDRGASTVIVTAVGVSEPPFNTKPIVGLAPTSAAAADALFSGLDAMTRQDEREQGA